LGRLGRVFGVWRYHARKRTGGRRIVRGIRRIGSISVDIWVFESENREEDRWKKGQLGCYGIVMLKIL
jgi:hypothetical protein